MSQLELFAHDTLDDLHAIEKDLRGALKDERWRGDQWAYLYRTTLHEINTLGHELHRVQAEITRREEQSTS